MLIRYLLASLMIFGLWGCFRTDAPKEDKWERRTLKEPLIKANQQLTIEESRMIDRYIERHDWDMTESPTGLRYQILVEGEGPKAATGDQVKVDYEISLMDGTSCYASKDDGPRTFVVGRDNVESGIHEGVQYLREGDEALFIVPYYLAHGLTGDGNCIPPKSSLVIKLTLVDIL